jgi:hypothetical protein
MQLIGTITIRCTNLSFAGTNKSTSLLLSFKIKMRFDMLLDCKRFKSSSRVFKLEVSSFLTSTIQTKSENLFIFKF